MFDAYDVAVRLRLKDEFTGVMGLVNRHLMQANTHATELQGRLDKIMGHFKTGAMVTAAGFGMAMTLKAATNEAVKYEQQLNRLKALQLDMRFGAGTTSGLEQQALAIARNTRGITSVDALKLVTEAQAITGNVGHTRELAPLLAKMRFAMETYMAGQGHGSGHGAGAEKQFADIVKVMEMRGLMRNFTEQKMEGMADLFVKNYAASGGMVRPSDFLAMMKTGGVASKSVDQDFMFALGHIMQEAGGNRSGTMLMSAYQNMVAGRMPQQVAETLMKLGLLDKHHVHYGTTGHITKVDPGAMKDSALLMARPDLYMQKVILPALAKHGVNTADHQKVLMALNSMTGQRTSGNFLAQLYLEGSQIANYIQQAKGAMGVNAMYAQGSKSTVGQQIDLMAKVNQLELDFGKAALPLLKSVLEQAIPLVKSLGGWMDKHPGGLKMMADGFGLLAASMMISGPLMMLTSSVRALGVVAPVAFSALGKLRGQLGAVGGVALAATAGYAVGTLLNEALSFVLKKVTGGRILSLGDLLYNTTHSSSDTSAGGHDRELMRNFYLHHPNQGDPMHNIRTRADGHVQVHTTINMDGRKVAHAVTEHQAAAASRPNAAQGGFDGSMTMRPVGAY